MKKTFFVWAISLLISIGILFLADAIADKCSLGVYTARAMFYVFGVVFSILHLSR